MKARHEERTSERLSRSKYSKDYELPERVESYSVRAGLAADGKLLVGALVKALVFSRPRSEGWPRRGQLLFRLRESGKV